MSHMFHRLTGRTRFSDPADVAALNDLWISNPNPNSDIKLKHILITYSNGSNEYVFFVQGAWRTKLKLALMAGVSLSSMNYRIFRGGFTEERMGFVTLANPLGE